MKIIKKTTLIAAVAAMAAFAVPSMASAAGWAPLNTNKTLTATSSVRFYVSGQYHGLSFTCSNSTLGVHVRTPASATLDITSASYTGCIADQSPTCTATVTPTGLPWTAPSTFAPNLSFAERLQVTYSCVGPYTYTVDGGIESGTYNNTTHTLSTQVQGYMALSLMGTNWGYLSGGIYHTYHETTNTLTLT